MALPHIQHDFMATGAIRPAGQLHSRYLRRHERIGAAGLRAAVGGTRLRHVLLAESRPYREAKFKNWAGR
jgi:hypothetical protein